MPFTERSSVLACSYLRLYSLSWVSRSRMTTRSESLDVISSSFRRERSDTSAIKPSMSERSCSTTSESACRGLSTHDIGEGTLSTPSRHVPLRVARNFRAGSVTPPHPVVRAVLPGLWRAELLRARCQAPSEEPALRYFVPLPAVQG